VQTGTQYGFILAAGLPHPTDLNPESVMKRITSVVTFIGIWAFKI
jgi:hypothetical protein